MVPLPAFIYGQSQEVRFLSLLILHQRRKNKDRTEGINLWNKLYHRQMMQCSRYSIFHRLQNRKKNMLN